MTEITSDKILINRRANRVYTFLSDLRNYENLMPDDVADFSASENEASLSLKGLGSFKIQVGEKAENQSIQLIPSGKLPFKFDINWIIESTGENCNVIGKINADLNMFMKMMAEPKLRSFVDNQAHKLKDYIEQETES